MSNYVERRFHFCFLSLLLSAIIIIIIIIIITEYLVSHLQRTGPKSNYSATRVDEELKIIIIIIISNETPDVIETTQDCLHKIELKALITLYQRFPRRGGISATLVII